MPREGSHSPYLLDKLIPSPPSNPWAPALLNDMSAPKAHGNHSALED